MALITEYGPPTDKIEALLSYPFAVPEGSYLTDGHELMQMPDAFKDFHDAVNKELDTAGLPSLEERIPIVSYGSNVNPVSFAEKMEPFTTEETHQLLQVTPFQEAEVDGSVVWHGKPGQTGSIFAELYDGPLLARGASTTCKLVWATKEQLAIMHTTEGVTYNLAEVEARAGNDLQSVKAYAYVAGHSSMLLKDGKAAPVARPGHEQAEDAMTAREAVAYMLGRIVNRNVAGLPQATTPEELVGEMSGQASLADKKAIQAAVQQELMIQGASQEYSYPAPHGAQIGRADFNFLNDYRVLHLMEEHLAGMRSPKLAKDIVAEVRRRAHNELKDRIESETPSVR